MLVLYENTKKHSAFTLPQVASATRGRAFVFADFFNMENINDNKCKIYGCNQSGHLNKSTGKRYFTLGYCDKHYRAFTKHGDPNHVREIAKRCKIEGCNGLPSTNKMGSSSFVKGYCHNHYNMYIKNGHPYTVRLKKEKCATTHPLYLTYSGMKDRCYSKNNLNYKYYGGRGIRIDDRWLGDNGFQNFCKDMGDRPEGMTIDRKDNNGDYSPSNCRWATRKTQSRNKRDILYVEYNGDKRMLIELCEEKELPSRTIHHRIFTRGWTVEKSIETPVRKLKFTKKLSQDIIEQIKELFLKNKNQRQTAIMFGISHTTVQRILINGNIIPKPLKTLTHS